MESNFLEKLKSVKDELKIAEEKDFDFSRDLQLELLLFTKTQISELTGKNELKKVVQNMILGILQDPDDDVSLGQLVRLLEVLNKSDNELTSSILGVLKQQIVVQQTNNFESPKQQEKPPIELNNISRDEYNKIKNIYEFIEKAKETEGKPRSDKES